MNISIWKKTLALGFMSLFITTAAIDPEQQQVAHEMVDQAQLKDLWEDQLSAIKNQFTRVDLNLQDLALAVNHDKTMKVDDKHAIIGEIMDIRKLVGSIERDPFINVDQTINIRLIQVLNGLVAHLKKAVDEGFTKLEAFDLESVIKKSASESTESTDPQHFAAAIEGAQKGIEEFEQASKNIGLTWYNKWYRKFDDAVIQPSLKHNLVSRAGKALFFSSLAWYFLWFRTDRGTRPENQAPFPREENKNIINTPEEVARIIQESNAVTNKKTYYEWEYWLRDKVGAYGHVNNVGLAYQDPQDHHYKGKNPMGILGDIDYKIWQFFHSQMALGTLAAPYLAPMLKTEADEAYAWTSKKVVELHNYLKGGAYRQAAYSSSHKGDPRYVFDDVVGLTQVKEQLAPILRFFQNPEKAVLSGLKDETGFLFSGPTRTGKSFIAEALAGEIRKILKEQNRNPEEMGFYTINSAMIKQNSLAGLLELAKREAPCVLFIDEIDLLRLQRTTDADMLSEFLTALSGVISGQDPRKPVFLIAATNKPQNLDGALKQRGRFGKEIRFNYPDFKERKEFIERRLQNLAVNTDELSIDQFVYETSGISYEDLNALIRAAFQRAKIHGRALDDEMLEEALDTEIRQIHTETEKDIPHEQRLIVSTHQAGHALATLLLPTGQKVAKVTILPVQNKLEEESLWHFGADKVMRKDDDQAPIENGKMFTYSTQDRLNIFTKQEKLNACRIHLAGHIAEELLLGECGYSYHVNDCLKGCSDSERAMALALSMVTNGMRLDDKTSKETREKFDLQAFALIETCRKEVRDLLEHHKEMLHLIADQLQEKATLKGTELAAMLDQFKASKQDATEQKPDLAPATPEVSSASVEKSLGIKEEKPE